MIPTSSNQFSHPDSSFLSKCVTNFPRVRQSPVHTALSEAMTFIPGRENADRMLTFVGELREIRKCNLVCRTKTCCINLQDRLCFFLGVSMLSVSEFSFMRLQQLILRLRSKCNRLRCCATLLPWHLHAAAWLRSKELCQLRARKIISNMAECALAGHG
jgi:hypothetical protein